MWVLKVTWDGVALCWGSTAGSSQGHIKVISRSNPAIILIKNMFLRFPYVFVLQRSVPQDCSLHLVAGKPSNTHPRGVQ